MASLALFFRTFKSSSIPMTNIKSISPIWLKNCKFPKDSTGNKESENSGKYKPSKDGPRTIPAIISPITDGCPIFLKTQPKKRATTIMVTICAKRMARGWCKLRDIESMKSFQCPFSVTGRRKFLCTSKPLPISKIQYIKAEKPPVTTK